MDDGMSNGAPDGLLIAVMTSACLDARIDPERRRWEYPVSCPLLNFRAAMALQCLDMEVWHDMKTEQSPQVACENARAWCV
jgi:hypothetical protein